MGLDAVELLIAVEEAFEIHITDEEAERTRTPRQLTELVASKLHAQNERTCLSQRAFHLLRRVFREQYQVPRGLFRPETSLDGLVPRENRKERWEQLRKTVGSVSWPELRLPKWISQMVIAVFLAAFVAMCWWLALARFSALRTLVIAAASGFAMLFLSTATFRYMRPLQISLGHQTVGSLAEHLVLNSTYLLTPSPEAWNYERIRLKVRQIIVDQLGIAPDFDDDAEFVRDLGVD